MAELEKMKRKRRMKNKKNAQKTIFPLILAALCSKYHNRKALIKKCLKRLFLSLPHVNLPPILSLLPSLLEFNCAEIVCKSAEIIGVASLVSFEMNEKIAMEDEILKGLISLLSSSKREIATAACNAVLDLSTTSVGRQRLLEFSATESFISVLGTSSAKVTEWESQSPALTVSIASDMTSLEEDEYPKLLIQGAIALINSCTVEQLHRIPTELSEKLLVHLKRLWGQAHKQRLCNSSSTCNQVNHESSISNIGTNDLAESIFRLSINHCLQREPIDFKQVKKSFLDLWDVGFEQFLSETWEISPMLIRNASKASLGQDGLFTPFNHFLGLKEGITTFLLSMLKNIVSCPAIASDELNILHIINEIKGHLGYPIIYSQDVRVVKTYSERELHYFQAPHILSINDILKCEAAFKEGYTIALRGMELRDKILADIAYGLASLFGQPSVGVNMYLTPSSSQGLARHSDDHCVFVCQLIGVKRWTIFPRQDLHLPRLYESCDSLHNLADGSCGVDSCQQFVLKEGDVLYIPRGFPHEARTDVDDDEISLHLTLAVEIEPPFEWEGFMHIAVHSWHRKTKALHHKTSDTLPSSLHVASVMLLQISVKLIGNLDSRFRKACLVGATPLASDTNNRLCQNQATFFKFLIGRIASESNFSDSAKHLEASLQKNEDPLEHVRWMKHLGVEGEERGRSADTRYLFDLMIQNTDIAECVFMQVKSMFCNEVEFEDVEQDYEVLLENYNKVRKQYSNGMLSLHSALHNVT